MNKRWMMAAGLSALALSAAVEAAEPNSEQLQQQIRQLQQQLDQLRQQVGQNVQRVEAAEQKTEATAAMLEQAPGTVAAGEGWWQRTAVGGYGELHYNGGRADEIDFHRFVLFFNHEFNDRLRLYSELELEHAFMETTEVELEDDGTVEEVERTPGELELEQAYIEYDLSANHRVKGGVFLVPVGILNETHEPNTFYGVERNPVEKNIIPTTWWEAGVGASGELAPGWNYDLALHSGLAVDPGGTVRGGRQKAAEAIAEDPALTSRIRYTGIAGLELGVTLQFQDDITQAADDGGEEATLLETHADWRSGNFGLRALYARWDIDGDAFAANGRDEQVGWYIEPSYRLNEELGVFTRFSSWNNAAGSDAEESEQAVVGLNYWPHPQVVVKADYQWQNEQAGDDDRVNLGIGYQF